MPRWRLGLLLCCLLAATLQIQVAQTHIHIPPYLVAAAGNSASEAAVAVPSSLDPDGAQGQRRDREPFGVCPLCQVVAYTGALATSASSDLPAQLVSGPFVSPAVVPLVSVAAVSFSWRGRAPPVV